MKRRDWRVLALVLAMTAAGPALAATERPPAQEGSPLTAQDRDHLREFLSRPGARTTCLRLDDPGAEGVACFDTSRHTAESDPSDDYYAFRVLGAARGRAGATLERVKVRVGFPSGHTTDWEPGQDYTVDETSLVRAEDPMTRRRLEITFRQGRVHPYVDERVFHNSWLADGHRLPCCEWAESGGIVEWAVPQSTLPDGPQATLEVTFRP
ncbi:MAG: hypothetical protein ACRD0C_19380 [Acidimicrobiia bacterium]